MYLTRRLKLALVPGVLALALVGAGCGGSDEKNGAGGMLTASADLDHYAGPTPLVVRFAGKAKNAKGQVHYRWRFDDGTQSEEQSPTHTFPRAGYYTVSLDIRDESGNNASQTYLLGAWPPRQWARAQKTPITRKGALRTERIQQQRTDKRRRDLRRQIEAGS
jgi:hypothetical protein